MNSNLVYSTDHNCIHFLCYKKPVSFGGVLVDVDEWEFRCAVCGRLKLLDSAESKGPGAEETPLEVEPIPATTG